jgi:hypothetical protein
MRAQGAAPEVPGKRPSSDSVINSGNGAIVLDSLPRVIRDRLIRAGVHALSDWLALGQQRYQIFGITKRMAAMVDALAVQK